MSSPAYSSSSPPTAARGAVTPALLRARLRAELADWLARLRFDGLSTDAFASADARRSYMRLPTFPARTRCDSDPADHPRSASGPADRSRSASDLADHPRDASDRPTSAPLAASDEASVSESEAWLICWPAGSSAPLHDHGEAQGVAAVLSGELTELRFVREAQRWVEASWRPGAIVELAPRTCHEVHNHSPRAAYSLHIYAPRLDSMTYYQRAADGSISPLRREAADQW